MIKRYMVQRDYGPYENTDALSECASFDTIDEVVRYMNDHESCSCEILDLEERRVLGVPEGRAAE